MNLNKEKKANLDSEKVNTSLDNLIFEAEEFFRDLDKNSDLIRSFEKKLTDRKLHIPFSMCVKTEKESEGKVLEDRHKNTQHTAKPVFFTTQVRWFLSWEEYKEQNGNPYRLLLISEEVERLYSEGYNELYDRSLFQAKRLSEKPFLATDMQTRFYYSDSFHLFIKAFHKHLRDKRISITTKEE